MNPEPVRKSITVKAPQARAFRVFTAGIDSWWPRTHHIGKSPMKKCIVEGRAGGRCYSEQVDGTECDWGQVLVWEPPRRFIMAWQVSPSWEFEPDLARASEVEIQFTPVTGGITRVDLEHRYFERHGEEVAAMARALFDSPAAWGGMFELYRVKAEEGEESE